jgi:zinc transporter ZupT
LLYGQSDELIALIQSIAAGALLVVVVNEMVPIAIRGIQRWAGVVAASGFVFSAAITWLSGG